jgi:hypothetical protein
MSNPHINLQAQLPNTTPVIVDTSNLDETIALVITPGSGSNTVKVEVSTSPFAATNPGAYWALAFGNGLTAGVTAAGVTTLVVLAFAVNALRFTRTVAGSGVDNIEITS